MKKNLRLTALLLSFSVLLTAQLCLGAPAANQESPTASAQAGTDPHVSIFWTKVIANYYGLCVNAALSFGVAAFSTGLLALVATDFRNKRGGKEIGGHAADNPLHAFGIAVFSGTAIAMTIQGFQNFVAAVQNWYITPANIKSVDIANF